jgi:UDP:flavonoid glycosyltransferase YjiC (YdhE family)
MTMQSLGLASNIRLVPWVPQNDVLGHAGVKVFVTQAGINSMYEAVYHAKPVVSLPLITEQAETAARVCSFA